MSPPTIGLGAYGQSDFPALADLWVAAWKGAGFAIDFEARRGWLETHLASLGAAGARIVVARAADGSPVGFVSIDPQSGYLDQLCVAPSAAGKGVGRRLLREAMRLSPGEVELDVNEANARAVRFYHRQGFCAVTKGLSAASGLPTIRMRWTAAL